MINGRRWGFFPTVFLPTARAQKWTKSNRRKKSGGVKSGPRGAGFFSGQQYGIIGQWGGKRSKLNLRAKLGIVCIFMQIGSNHFLILEVNTTLLNQTNPYTNQKLLY